VSESLLDVEVLTTEDVAVELMCSRSFVCALARRGELRGYKIGHIYMIFRESLNEWLRRNQFPGQGQGR
jgi:excisionase family DNA binding protein